MHMIFAVFTLYAQAALYMLLSWRMVNVHSTATELNTKSVSKHTQSKTVNFQATAQVNIQTLVHNPHSDPQNNFQMHKNSETCMPKISGGWVFGWCVIAYNIFNFEMQSWKVMLSGLFCSLANLLPNVCKNILFWGYSSLQNNKRWTQMCVRMHTH